MVRKKGKKSFLNVRGKILAILFILLIVINAFNYYIVHEKSQITGRDTSDFAFVGFIIEDNLPWINILEPENITYNFTNAEPLSLNLTGVSSAAFESWVFHIYDLRSDEWFRENYSFGGNSFFPNTTIPVVRGGNLLIVNATLPSGVWASDNVTFTVVVENSSPILGPINDPIYGCEGRYLLYHYNATDIDWDILSSQLINASPYFSTFRTGGNGMDLTDFTLFYSDGRINKTRPISPLLVNQGFKDFLIRVEVTDGQGSDFAYTTITLIEINNPPVITPNLTTITLYNKGDNSSFYVDLDFFDVEASLGWGAISTNFSLVNVTDGLPVSFMTMDSNGVINFTADNSTPLGNFNGAVCAIDDGLDPATRHPFDDVICGQNGDLDMMTCDTFQLTITDENRPPTIVRYAPDNLTQNVGSTYPFLFNITDYDPDGTIPDTYWYVDGNLMEFDEASYNDSFSYSFGCGRIGDHNVTVISTDGLLNDSVTWNITLSLVPCPSGSSSGGGGGGGGGGPAACVPLWACDYWSVCQNAKKSLDLGLISGENYRFISENCSKNYFDEERCGYQTRKCLDFVCNLTKEIGDEYRICLYTVNPTCSDGIQNCHDDSCELLVDCGGPCDPCPSCSDKIKNQGEDGVDCGGPCPWQCEPEVPLLKRGKTIYIFLVIILIIIILIVVKLIRVLKYKRAIDNSGKANV